MGPLLPNETPAVIEAPFYITWPFRTQGVRPSFDPTSQQAARDLVPLTNQTWVCSSSRGKAHLLTPDCGAGK